jgi:hypothetical protein
MESQSCGNKKNYKHFCKWCYYYTDKKSSFDKHLVSRKHICNIDSTLCNEKVADNLVCLLCNKIYKSRVSLWRHKKLCNFDETSIENTIIENTIIDPSLNELKVLTNIVIELVKNNTELQKQTSELQKQNHDFQKQVLEICKNNNTTINNTNSNNTTNNKTFNLQLFLNEECKDAMNMSEFINSIEINVSDLENIGKLGYVEGMSNIIIKQLNDTDMYKRPVHCIGVASSDAKRETVYVREENKWERDNSETKRMIKAVRGIDKKNYQMLTSWKEMDPKCMDSKSNQCDKYMKIMSKVMDGDIENVHKVIKKIAKEVVIEK